MGPPSSRQLDGTQHVNLRAVVLRGDVELLDVQDGEELLDHTVPGAHVLGLRLLVGCQVLEASVSTDANKFKTN